jgi:thermitase
MVDSARSRLGNEKDAPSGQRVQPTWSRTEVLLMLMRRYSVPIRIAVPLLGASALALVPLAVVSAQTTRGPAASARATFVDDEVLVKFRPGTSATEVAASHQTAGGQVIREVQALDVKVVRVVRGQAVQRVAVYQRNPNVEYAELNGIAYPNWTPNDPLYDSAADQQWALNNTGKTGGTPDRDIDAPQAWDVSRGSATVTVAVVDTGIMVDHPDLSGKIVESRNWYDGTSINDAYGHGTHVAGIAAATTNNGIGIAGVCANCALLNAKVCDDFGGCPYDRIANGILWSVGCEWRDAANNCLSPVRAKAINVSLAGTYDSTTLRNAVERAWARGAVLACAAGNAGSSTRNYPAAYLNCIAVAATDANDSRASWSNYGGSWVDAAAPGVDIWSTLNPNANTFSSPSGYGRLSGTSMSSPHVAGLAGLLWSNGLSSNAAVRDRIESSVDKLPGTGNLWSKGRINACRALGGTGC